MSTFLLFALLSFVFTFMCLKVFPFFKSVLSSQDVDDEMDRVRSRVLPTKSITQSGDIKNEN